MNDEIFRASLADGSPTPPPIQDAPAIRTNPYRPTLHGQKSKVQMNWLLMIGAIVLGLVVALVISVPFILVMSAVDPDRKRAADARRGLDKMRRAVESSISK